MIALIFNAFPFTNYFFQSDEVIKFFKQACFLLGTLGTPQENAMFISGPKVCSGGKGKETKADFS